MAHSPGILVTIATGKALVGHVKECKEIVFLGRKEKMTKALGSPSQDAPDDYLCLLDHACFAQSQQFCPQVSVWRSLIFLDVRN